MRDIRPIRTEEDLAWAIAEVSKYFDSPPSPGTEDADRFDVLSDLIETYENRFHGIDVPEPIELLKSFMDMTGRSQSELAALLGSRSRASEILNRRRALTIEMIQKLNAEWGMPAEHLVQPYKLAAE